MMAAAMFTGILVATVLAAGGLAAWWAAVLLRGYVACGLIACPACGTQQSALSWTPWRVCS
ncbi:MAG: hypothetical protein KDA85_17745, partial [Planctomycetaceae bacterium]|nr:hypothetical protein [Planctomycetaceae bacterium]